MLHKAVGCDVVVVPQSLLNAYRGVAECIRADDYLGAVHLVEAIDAFGLDVWGGGDAGD